MSRTGRSLIHSVLTKEDVESFVAIYQIPKRFSPTLPGTDDPAVCTSEKIVLYTLAFSFCGVRYPLSPFKVELLKHFGIQISQLNPFAFMRVVHFELSCVAVSGEPSVPLFCIFYKLLSDGDWFTFAKQKDSVSPPCYSFMPTSTYPIEWKNRFIFVSAAMLPESPPLRDPKASIDDSVPVLSVNDTVSWKRMHENPTRAYNFLEGVLAMGGMSPLYSVRPRAYFGKKEKSSWEGEFVYVGGSAATERGEETSSQEEDSSKEVEGSKGSLLSKNSSGDEHEDLESRLIRKRKASTEVSHKAVIPEPRNIRLRLRSASGQKPFPASKATSEVPPTGAKSSLSKHLKSSSLGNSKAPIVIPAAPAFSRVKDKAPETSVAHTTPATEVSPLRATGTSKLKQPEDLFPRSPLAPMFAEGLPVPYVLKWKITPSIVVGTPETARDFLNHAVPPLHRFMNFALDPNLFDDQYSLSICEGFFRGLVCCRG
ncbi:hypothetical protein HanRHA438_Chr12g0561911 [Helianthus annuus]|uniref:Transposase (putative) gypsy type domain-containing protein n=1 Tax=Helianthus annuus TaxID=4232 RepID=A0A9K3MXA7_HELAN|nr:hypothetical protein HanXRQr2_Chr12g0550611 [Helianthus annuus]KAJ0494152.1 hypothetical protein HanIR_Chr12g0594181 [Helianthus annuus]KAJ0505977.1 hypothetical protein HanHA89_Chr12g0476671 [Helianthus annuus]KAJ0675648.1 hypothetical protein HanLR1_Chr12g0453571 [Helianthus annuus]KAJ0678926.1 hypothetical protein HanOQP8_Chr12g0453471 [Helianthus annuus]